jgi:hypothetical protein
MLLLACWSSDPHSAAVGHLLDDDVLLCHFVVNDANDNDFGCVEIEGRWAVEIEFRAMRMEEAEEMKAAMVHHSQ